MVYVAVNLFSFFLDLTYGNDWWFYWPLFGWGIGLAAHTFNVFGLGSSWEEKKVKELTNEK